MGEPIYKDEAYAIVAALESAGVARSNLRELTTPQGRWRLIQIAAFFNLTSIPTIGGECIISITQDLVRRVGLEVIWSFTDGEGDASCILAVRQGTLMTSLFRFFWMGQTRYEVVQGLWDQLLRIPDVQCPYNNRELVISRKVSA